MGPILNLHCCALTTTSTLNIFPSFLLTFHLQHTMTRKKPLLDQCPNTPPRRRSARRRLSKSPTKLQSQHNIKTRLRPSSPLSGTSESLYGDIGYQSPAPILNPPTTEEVAWASVITKAKGKEKEVDTATYLPANETPIMPSVSDHGTRHSTPCDRRSANDQGESSQSSRLSSAPSTPRRVGQRPSNVQLRVDVHHKVGESSQSSPLSTPPSERRSDHMPRSPLSSPPDRVRVKKSRKRVKEPNTKDSRSLANTTTAMPKSSKSKQTRGRSRSPSLCKSAIPEPTEEPAGSDIPDIGLPMKDIWENLYANLEDHVPEVHVKEENSLGNAVELVKKREPTRIPSR